MTPEQKTAKLFEEMMTKAVRIVIEDGVAKGPPVDKTIMATLLATAAITMLAGCWAGAIAKSAEMPDKHAEEFLNDLKGRFEEGFHSVKRPSDDKVN